MYYITSIQKGAMIANGRVLWYILILLVLGFMLACNSDKVSVLPVQTDQDRRTNIDSLNAGLLVDLVIPDISRDSVSIENPDSLPEEDLNDDADNAYDRLKFGMTLQEVNDLNEAKQKLVNHCYRFSYSFNDKGELYAIYLRSDAEKAIYYETRLQSKYSNLCRIISEKYGNKDNCGTLPSIFEVMNNKTMFLAKWRLENKLIQVGITQVELNGYKVLCKISNPVMEQEAKRQNYLKKNKKRIDASEKF
ncbi:MAG: hypothetical protein IPN29_07850 [Saprospiraceae bacterium]|nr:hypothetical protein [Saprospiraceae bacterium]